MIKRLYILFLTAAIGLLSLTSCSSDDYLNAIPKESTALIAIDVAQMTGEAQGMNVRLLKSLFKVSDVGDCGIDLSAKIYLFEAPDGNLGLAAKVKDGDNVKSWLDKLSAKGICQKTRHQRDIDFTVLNKSWVVAFNDDALLVMGPALSNSQQELLRRMTKYLDAEEGITASPLYDRIADRQSAVTMVAQTQALPQQLIAPFTLGAPADTDPSQVLIAADLTADNGSLLMRGETFSFDSSIDESLRQSASVYRPLTKELLPLIPRQTLFALMMNANGEQLLPMMKQSREFRALLTGAGMRIDVDSFIQQVDGDLVLTLPDYDEEHMQMGWAAQLTANRTPLDDESERELEKTRLQTTDQPLPASIQHQLEGKRMVVMLNLGAVTGEKKELVDTFTALLKPLFGDVSYLIFYRE